VPLADLTPQPAVATALGAFDLDHLMRVVGQRVVQAHQELAFLGPRRWQSASLSGRWRHSRPSSCDGVGERYESRAVAGCGSRVCTNQSKGNAPAKGAVDRARAVEAGGDASRHTGAN